MSDNYCNNCGKYGHNYNQCKLPITSLGAIAFRIKDTNIEYLMIRRKDTLGFIDFMRGKYSLTNKDYIMNMLKQMTTLEKHKLNTWTFNQIWSDIWGNNNAINQYKNEETSSRNKFNQLKLGVHYKNKSFSLNEMIIECNQYTSWDEPEWGFPKGRRNFNETDLNCALREFEEETGYIKSNIKLVQNIIPYEEIFTGSNMKSYKHKYYLSIYFGDSDTIPSQFQQTEIGDVRWMSYDDCVKHIRNYNLEKLDMFKKVNKVFTKYRIY